MTVQKIVIHQCTAERPQPLLEVQYSGGNNNSNSRFAEVAGGTTAECAAVCCCCPFALVNLLVLAVYGVPAGLYRKALRKKRRRRLLKKKKGLLIDGDGDGDSDRRSSYDAAELLIHEATTIRYDVTDVVLIGSPAERFTVAAGDSEVVELEKEMWKRFYGTGFWRSASQRID